MAKFRRRGKASQVVVNDQTRLFLRHTDTACCCGTYSYHSCIGIGDLSQSRSEKEKFYCPDPNKYNEFIVIAELDGVKSDGSGSFSTNYGLGHSMLKQLYDQGCYFDAQIHIGACSDPSDFSKFEQVILLQNVQVTSYALSNLSAMQASERGIVGENVDFKFSDMVTIPVPNPVETVNTLINSGPIIDSFVSCDSNCCMCPDSAGTYLVQLAQCDDDCVEARILYRTDCNQSWKKFSTPVCTDINCATPVNKNVLLGNDGSFNYIYLNPNFGTTIREVIANSVITIPSNAALNGDTMVSADGCGCQVIFVGGSTILRYNTVSKTYSELHSPSIPLTNINFCDVSICDDCETAFIAADNGRVLELNLTTLEGTMHYLNNGIGQVNHVEAVSCCSFIASVAGKTYYSCNGKIANVSNILGSITAIHAVSDTIVYAASIYNDLARLYMSVDGGASFMAIREITIQGYHISNIYACDDDASQVVFAGYFNPTGVTEADAQSCQLFWMCEDTPGVLFDNVCGSDGSIC